MADTVLTKQTSLSGEDVITRAVQFFSNERWRATTQSARTATFEGRVPVPWFMILFTVIGYICCLIPGIIMYVAVVRKLRRFQNLVVAATPTGRGSEVTLTCPSHSKGLAGRFFKTLPDLETV